MLTATILAIFLIPLFFVMVRGWFKGKVSNAHEAKA